MEEDGSLNLESEERISTSFQNEISLKNREKSKEQLQDLRQHLAGIAKINVALKALRKSQALEQEDLYYSLQKRLDDRYSRETTVEYSRIHLEVEMEKEELQFKLSLASAESAHEAVLIPVNSALNEAEGDLRKVKHLRDAKHELTEKVAELEKVLAAERLAQITDIFERDKVFVRGKEDAHAGHMLASRKCKKDVLKNATYFLREKKAEAETTGVELDVNLENRSRFTWVLLERCDKALETNRVLRNELELVDGTGEAIAGRIREVNGTTERIRRKMQRNFVGIDDHASVGGTPQPTKQERRLVGDRKFSGGNTLPIVTRRGEEVPSALQARRFEVGVLEATLLHHRTTLEQMQLRLNGVIEARTALCGLCDQAIVLLLGCSADSKRVASEQTKGGIIGRISPRLRSQSGDFEWLLGEAIPARPDDATATELASLARFLLQRLHDYRFLLRGENAPTRVMQRSETKGRTGHNQAQQRTRKDSSDCRVDGLESPSAGSLDAARGRGREKDSADQGHESLVTGVENRSGGSKDASAAEVGSQTSADSLLPPLAPPPPPAPQPLALSGDEAEEDREISERSPFWTRNEADRIMINKPGTGDIQALGASLDSIAPGSAGMRSVNGEVGGSCHRQSRPRAMVGTARLSKTARQAMRNVPSQRFSQLPNTAGRAHSPLLPVNMVGSKPALLPPELVTSPSRYEYTISISNSASKRQGARI